MVLERKNRHRYHNVGSVVRDDGITDLLKGIVLLVGTLKLDISFKFLVFFSLSLPCLRKILKLGDEGKVLLTERARLSE